MRGWDLSSSVGWKDQPGRVELQWRAVAVDLIGMQ